MAISDIEKAGSSIADMITKHKEASQKAKQLAEYKQSALSLTERIKQSGGDAKTADLFAEGISEVNDPKVISKLMTAAISTFVQTQKLNQPKGAFMVKQLPDGGVSTVNAVTGEQVTDPSMLTQGSYVVKETLTPEMMGLRALAQREATTENPQLDQMTQSAIAANDFVEPRIDNALKLLDEIGPDEFEKLKTQVQIGANNEFLVPNGSPLEDLVAELNDVKLTGFGIAGSAYSVNEKQTVEGGLSPLGKSFKRFKRDLVRNKDFFKSRMRAGTMGLKEARAKASEGSTYSAGENNKEDSGSQIFKVGGVTYNIPKDKVEAFKKAKGIA